MGTSKGKILVIGIGIVIVFVLWYVFIHLPQQEEDDLFKRGCVIKGTRGPNGIQTTYSCPGENPTTTH
jgi:hypothetical protein